MLQKKTPTGVSSGVVAIIIVLSNLIYLAGVYHAWREVEELLAQIPPFVISGMGLGVVCCCFPFKRPYRSTFLIGAAGPVFSTMTFGFLTILVGIANAGGFNLDFFKDPWYIILLASILSLIFGALHGFLAISGHYVGRKALDALSDYLKTGVLSVSELSNEDGELRAAKLSARTTLFVGIFASLVNVVIALINLKT